MFIENELAETLSLDGEWQFRLAGGASVTMPVPAAWEAYIPDKITDGPALYRRRFDLPDTWLARDRLLLEFGAVSHWALVRVNKIQVGVHRGAWSPFQMEITRWAHAGENDLEIEVWKPGRRFPVRESLAGFLPDVATTFGGLWQSARLLALDAAIVDLKVVCLAGSRVKVTGAVIGPGVREVEVMVDTSEPARVPVDEGAARFAVELDLRGLARWQPEKPARHRLTVSVLREGECRARASRTIGLRDVSAQNGRAWIDGRPLHLRGVLDWGWQPDRIRPAPAREAVARQIELSRALGFNLIKLCLFVPDEATFQAADEAGEFLWLEMPLWLPHLTPEAKELARQEYSAVFRRLHHHPSIVVLSLGCELNAEADAEFLAELHALAREWLPNALLCDNSGSAEAYGGVATGLQDFHDYHFYTDPHFFRPLVDHFERDDRARQPWIFGEFCDADTGRNFQALSPAPWWLTEPVALDRDDFRFTQEHAARLSAAGVTDGGAALTQIARRQATAVRKYVLEQTRLHGATGGYVVTGWADTPITTSGIVDDQGELKFEGDEWQRFNSDGVLLIERDRRRRWVAGGDRPAFRDPFSWWVGEPDEVRLLLSNAMGAIAGGRLYWRLTAAGRGELGSAGQTVGPIPAAEVRRVETLRLPWLDEAERPVELVLQTDLTLSLASGHRRSVRNQWSLWAVPRPSLGEALAVWNLDAVAARLDLAELDPNARLAEARQAPAAPWLACDLTTELLAQVWAGRNGVLWMTQPDRRFTQAAPFWREAIHVFEPHAIWADVPQTGHADLRFFGIASDMTLNLSALQAELGPSAVCRPVWRRFDARSLTWAEYLVEVQYGRGRLFVTSLRLAGGLGCQPHGLRANPWGAWILAALLRAVNIGGP